SDRGRGEPWHLYIALGVSGLAAELETPAQRAVRIERVEKTAPVTACAVARGQVDRPICCDRRRARGALNGHPPLSPQPALRPDVRTLARVAGIVLEPRPRGAGQPIVRRCRRGGGRDRYGNSRQPHEKASDAAHCGLSDLPPRTLRLGTGRVKMPEAKARA